MLKKLSALILAIVLCVTVMTTAVSAASATQSLDEQDAVATASAEVSETESTEEDNPQQEESEPVDIADSGSSGTRPANHMQCAAWLEDSNGVMATIINANESYTMHVRVWVVGSKDATGAKIGLPEPQLNGVWAPGSNATYEGMLSYWSFADNVGADVGDIRLKSATTDFLKLMPVNGSGKVQLGNGSTVSAPDYEIFSDMFVKLGTSKQDGDLPVGKECEFTMEFKAVNASASATVSAPSTQTGGQDNAIPPTDNATTANNPTASASVTDTGSKTQPSPQASAPATQLDSTKDSDDNSRETITLSVAVGVLIGILAVIAIVWIKNKLFSKKA